MEGWDRAHELPRTPGRGQARSQPGKSSWGRVQRHRTKSGRRAPLIELHSTASMRRREHQKSRTDLWRGKNYSKVFPKTQKTEQSARAHW